MVVVAWGVETSTADDAIVRLYQTHGRRLVALLTMYVGDQATAEDLVQEAFLRTYRAWPRIRDHERAASYLRTTAFNLARSTFRRRSVVRRRPEDASAEGAPADTDVMLHEEQRRVIDALRRLPARQRECLVLRFYGELAEVEIARTLRISPNSVKTHTRRGLAALERHLEARA
jgi:RNA polymerase sigma-70 factor (sigma-E family)